MSVRFWSQNLKELDHFEDLTINGRVIIKIGFEYMCSVT